MHCFSLKWTDFVHVFFSKIEINQFVLVPIILPLLQDIFNGFFNYFLMDQHFCCAWFSCKVNFRHYSVRRSLELRNRKTGSYKSRDSVPFKGLCSKWIFFWRLIIVKRYFFMHLQFLQFFVSWLTKESNSKFSLLCWNFLVILKILSVTC